MKPTAAMKEEIRGGSGEFSKTSCAERSEEEEGEGGEGGEGGGAGDVCCDSCSDSFDVMDDQCRLSPLSSLCSEKMLHQMSPT